LSCELSIVWLELVMAVDCYSLFCRHAAVSFGKQQRLANLVGSSVWHFDLSLGMLGFGNEHLWKVQILGTEAGNSQTWLWSWANEACNIPTQLRVSALTLRLLGQQHGIPEFSEPQFPLDVVNGHTLAMIASGVCRADAYYRCPYEGGAAFVLIQDPGFPSCTQPPLRRLVSVFPQAVSSLDIPDHHLALTGYLEYYGIPFQSEGNNVVVRENREPVLTAEFDACSRLTNLEAIIRAEEKPETLQ
jgi:hypothetical protein